MQLSTYNLPALPTNVKLGVNFISVKKALASYSSIYITTGESICRTGYWSLHNPHIFQAKWASCGFFFGGGTLGQNHRQGIEPDSSKFPRLSALYLPIAKI